jgi:hypothetical protein
MSTWKKTNLYITLYLKINSKDIIDRNANGKIMKFLEINVRENNFL